MINPLFLMISLSKTANVIIRLIVGKVNIFLLRKKQPLLLLSAFPVDRAIEVEILHSALRPRVVTLHAVEDEGIELFSPVHITGIIELVHTAEVILVVEDISCRSVSGIDVLDRVVKPAGIGDERQSPIAHGDQLGGSAWFKIGGHQEKVGGGVEKVSKILVVSFDEIDTRIPQRFLKEGILHLSGSDDNKPGVLLLEMWEDLHDPIDALLRAQTGDGGKERNIDILGDTELFQQGSLVLLLLALIGLFIVVGNKLLICSWIPDIDIQSVDDAAEIIMPAPIQNCADPAESLMIGDQLSGVGLRDGVDLVGRHDASLQIVEGIAHLDIARIEITEVQVEILRQIVSGRPTLEGRVVDRQNGLDAPRIIGEEQRKDGCLPIVAVDDIVDVVTGDEGVDGHHEAGEAFVIIAIAVHVVSVETVHRREVEVDTGDDSMEDAAALSPPVHLEIELIIKSVHDFRMLVSDRFIERGDDGGFFSVLHQSLGIREDEIR